MELRDICKELRQTIFKTAYKGGTGHIASALSVVEIMTVLYFGNVLHFDQSLIQSEHRDKLIMSKGHASLALYSVLTKLNILTKEELATFCKPGSHLGGEPKLGDIKGVEATTGSLGHGLSFATGIAMTNRLDQKSAKVYVILGDGECQEGSVWEAAMSAAHHKLSNLTVILDQNKLQAMDTTESILGIEPLREKWEAFGWHVEEVDGHCVEQLQLVFQQNKKNQIEKPRIIIANTIKGKGVTLMENVPIWHYRMPNSEELAGVLRDLDMNKEDLLL